MNLRAMISQNVYNYLDVGKSPHRADCIFVLAGRQVRKIQGINLWRLGYAPQLILSVGRFEWRKLSDLNIGTDRALNALAANIPPKYRHFLVRLDLREVFCDPVRKGFFGTRTEAQALAKYVRNLSIRSLLVLSSPSHLRRTSLTFGRAFRKSGIRLTFVAIPEEVSFEDPDFRKPIWVEFGKYLFYKLFLL